MGKAAAPSRAVYTYGLDCPNIALLIQQASQNPEFKMKSYTYLFLVLGELGVLAQPESFGDAGDWGRNSAGFPSCAVCNVWLSSVVGKWLT